MARYFTRSSLPKSEYFDYPVAENYLSRTVHEPEPVCTGLLDANGDKIYRTMDQIGFIRYEN